MTKNAFLGFQPDIPNLEGFWVPDPKMFGIPLPHMLEMSTQPSSYHYYLSRYAYKCVFKISARYP